MNIISLFKKQFQPDGVKIARSSQDHNPPENWIFRGFRDEDDQEIYLGDYPNDQPFSAYFEAVGYIAAANDSIKVDGMDINLHFVLAEKQSKNHYSKFQHTKQGGILAQGFFKGYFKQFHASACNEKLKKMIFDAHKNQSPVKISGSIQWLTFVDSKIQKDCEFLRFDRKQCCPVINLDSVDYVPQYVDNGQEIRMRAARSL